MKTASMRSSSIRFACMYCTLDFLNAREARPPTYLEQKRVRKIKYSGPKWVREVSVHARDSDGVLFDAAVEMKKQGGKGEIEGNVASIGRDQTASREDRTRTL